VQSVGKFLTRLLDIDVTAMPDSAGKRENATAIAERFNPMFAEHGFYPVVDAANRQARFHHR